ncbi:histone-binding protein RBBP4 [Fonticula alba]|uniref:Histone-binding protein RBBP4 n=1 Tax=Fonticula alba TaxID=691883 RepID=A0A058Z807_FONAL|nr:histone-binding protein RBBP4 [Fonticula alba]KCV70028.1 histone-binding protein RBBP4 [Fonticula alba]|eukprot:XP_009495634.1 histone-binding protein RBBP4 [Fonticula alba]
MSTGSMSPEPNAGSLPDVAAEKRINDEYKTWKKNTPFLYDMVIMKALSWPSLTIEWLPEMTEGPNETIHRMILGTHTDPESASENMLMIAQLELPSVEVSPNDPTVFQFRRQESGAEPRRTKITIEQCIPHEGEINRARYMPQNPNMIATKTISGQVHLFDTTKFAARDDTKGPTMRLTGHSKEGYGLSWNRNQSGLLLSSADDKLICLWDVAAAAEAGPEGAGSLAPLFTFEGHTKEVGEVAWHNVQAHLFGSVGDDRTLRLWDSRTRKNTLTVTAHDDCVNSLSFNPFSEHLLATGSSDQSVALWDMRNLKQKLHSCEYPSGEVLQVAWSPHYETILASAAHDRRVHIWDMSRIGEEQTSEEANDGPPELMFIHGGHTNRVSDISWNPNIPMMMASTADDNVIQCWQMSSSIYLDDDQMDIDEAELERR